MLSFNQASPDIYKILKEHAHKNRLNMTLAEAFLWEHIRKKQIGYNFLRQYIIGDYIVDFICRENRLIIEVDGAYHSEPRQEQDDRIRENRLREYGYSIIRFTNEEVLYDIENVLNVIKENLI